MYNETVHDYRRRHGLRSLNHPVPDLAQEGDWLEAPFWAWRPGQARRGRLFVRRTRAALELRAGSDTWPTLPLPDTRGLFIPRWQELEQEGYKVRSRALTTTPVLGPSVVPPPRLSVSLMSNPHPFAALDRSGPFPNIRPARAHPAPHAPLGKREHHAGSALSRSSSVPLKSSAYRYRAPR